MKQSQFILKKKQQKFTTKNPYSLLQPALSIRSEANSTKSSNMKAKSQKS